MDYCRIKIITKIDRPHLTYDVLSIIYANDVSIINMEVFPYVIYLKVPIITNNKFNCVKDDLLSIKDIKTIEKVNLIASEKKEIEIKTVMNTIQQGILVVDELNNIKYINKFAQTSIFNESEQNLINKNVFEIINNTLIKKLLNSSKLEIPKEKFEIEINNKNYLINLDPVVLDREIGAVISLQDIKPINEIYTQKHYGNTISFKNIIGNSNKIKEVIEKSKVLANTDSPVFITGESGTGKEMFARAIHTESTRKYKPFVSINCAAIPDQLLESELFGYEGGSFTGSRKNGKTGILELANGGTVFFDEIGDMPSYLQAKLLRVLQENKIRKIGGYEEIPINIRILSATNRNIKELIKKGMFRIDLYYRINVFSVKIPPLRERQDDIKVLTDYYVKEYMKKYKKDIKGISKKAYKKITSYNWPGNVRELKNTIERTVVMKKGTEIDENDVLLNNVLNDNAYLGNDLKEIIKNKEKQIILNTLNNTKSIRAAARTLNVSHTLIINRIKKYNIGFISGQYCEMNVPQKE